MSGELLFGIHSIDAALSNDPKNILELYFESDSQNARIKELSEKARELGLKPHARPREALDRMTGGARHQGAVARYRAPPPRTEKELYELVEQAGKDTLILVLDGVTDPHNLGACLRSAEAAGVTAVVVPKDKAAGITPTVRRASSGAADRVAFFAVTNLARTLKALKESGVWLVGLAGESTQDFYKLDLKGPLGIVMGSEGEGMRRLTGEACDFLARIPMRGGVESLNVSVATGVALFEALRQRA
ncbi:23S rRNA (guanosine(2251)-2'-O)-methyltransferase RlmB [Rudaea sp.]|uniref:23S rRNA (guanosine(2251)-2'-O)-methyltransferase RlmB n=1 Tax=Rudaea sp. TaxID=2136325 RepID=UPI002ED247D9